MSLPSKHAVKAVIAVEGPIVRIGHQRLARNIRDILIHLHKARQNDSVDLELFDLRLQVIKF